MQPADTDTGTFKGAAPLLAHALAWTDYNIPVALSIAHVPFW